MRHPFAGVSKSEPSSVGQPLSRRGALGRMLFATAGLLGANAAAAAEKSTEAVGEEGGLRQAILQATSGALGEEGAAAPGNGAPTTEPFGEEAGNVTSWIVPGLEDGINQVPVNSTKARNEEGGVSSRELGEEGGKPPVDAIGSTEAKGEEGGGSTRGGGEEGGVSSRELGEEGGLNDEQLKKLKELALQPSTAAVGEEGGSFQGLTQVAPLSHDHQSQQLAAVWQHMGDTVAGPQNCAVLYGSKQAISVLAKNLESKVLLADPQRVARLLAELDHDDFHVRERAAGDLAGLGLSALPALEEALQKATSVEVQNRVRRLLEQAQESAALLQLRRGFEVLVCLKTPEAKQLVEKLAQAKPATLATGLARAALGRM